MYVHRKSVLDSVYRDEAEGPANRMECSQHVLSVACCLCCVSAFHLFRPMLRGWHVLHVLSLVCALHLLHLFLCSVVWALLVVRCTLHVVCVACCHYNVHTQMEVEDHRMADLKAFLPQCIKSRLDAQQV